MSLTATLVYFLKKRSYFFPFEHNEKNHEYHFLQCMKLLRLWLKIQKFVLFYLHVAARQVILCLRLIMLDLDQLGWHYLNWPIITIVSWFVARHPTKVVFNKFISQRVSVSISALRDHLFFHWTTSALDYRDWKAYLFIELVDDPLCPLQVQFLTLQRSIDISQFDAHLAHQQSVIFVGPINPRHSFITHLERCAQKGVVEMQWIVKKLLIKDGPWRKDGDRM